MILSQSYLLGKKVIIVTFKYNVVGGVVVIVRKPMLSQYFVDSNGSNRDGYGRVIVIFLIVIVLVVMTIEA